jgi:hypothetical protein
MMTLKSTKRMRPDDAVTDADPGRDDGTDAEPVIFHENYVLEGNCRVACVSTIAEQVNRSRHRVSRAASRGRGIALGPAPPPMPGA